MVGEHLRLRIYYNGEVLLCSDIIVTRYIPFIVLGFPDKVSLIVMYLNWDVQDIYVLG